MDLEFIKESAEEGNSGRVFFQMADRPSGVQVGRAEGYLGSSNELTAVIHVDEAYHKQGIGKAALLELIRNWGEDTITGIVGSWHADEEFGYLPDGMSTNLRIFKLRLSEGLTPEEAAWQTPTGKWAKSLGFCKLQVLKNYDTEASVLFTR